MHRRQFLFQAGFSSGLLFSSLGSSVLPSQAPHKLGVVLVGLGNYSTHQLAPALQETEHCRLAGIVTGTPAKAETWAK
jgi:hypothetical protein